MPGPPPCRYCNLIFHIVGRELAPPLHIVFIALYSRQVAHVGAAYMPPAHPARITNFPHLLRCRGRACPALHLAVTAI